MLCASGPSKCRLLPWHCRLGVWSRISWISSSVTACMVFLWATTSVPSGEGRGYFRGASAVAFHARSLAALERTRGLRDDAFQNYSKAQRPKPKACSSQLRQHDAFLRLVFAFAIFLADFADFVGFEEEDLAQSFVGVDLCGKRRRVGDYERNEAFPLGFEGGDVYDDPAAGIGRLADADGQHLSL